MHSISSRDNIIDVLELQRQAEKIKRSSDNALSDDQADLLKFAEEVEKDDSIDAFTKLYSEQAAKDLIRSDLEDILPKKVIPYIRWDLLLADELDNVWADELGYEWFEIYWNDMSFYYQSL